MRRLANALLFLCAVAAAAAARAQMSDADLAAREAIRGSFLSCAAAGVLSEQAAVGERLRRRLALPPDASRDRIYDAICDLTAPRSPRVRKAGDEFVLEAGELELRMQYDAGARHITRIDSNEAPTPPPIAEPEKPKPVAEPEKPKSVAQPEKPKPMAEPEQPKPVVEAARPEPAPPAPLPKPVATPARPAKPQPAAVIRLPPPVVRTGPCVVKPVMTDEDLRNCGASASAD